MTVWQYLCKWECHVSCLLYESWLNFDAHLWQHNYPRFDTRLIHETCTMLLTWSPSHMERANKDLFLNGLPSKHESSTQCQCPSTQHWTSIGWMTRVCLVCRINGDWTQDAGLAAVTVRRSASHVRPSKHETMSQCFFNDGLISKHQHLVLAGGPSLRTLE